MNVPQRLLATAICAVFLLALAAPAGAAVPRDFFGVMLDGPAIETGSSGVNLAAEAPVIASTGAGSVRVAFYWWDLQPWPGQVDFTKTDRIVAAMARAGLRVLPVVLGTPRWAARGDDPRGAIPRDPRMIGDVMEALVRRYGRGGTFWRTAGVPERPIRAWQIWNEPHLELYWNEDPWAPGYVGLLREAYAAVKRTDRQAKVLSAGLTNGSWANLALLYQAGAREHFDAAAIHPFSATPANVMRIVKMSRAVMRRWGDARKPLVLTEVSWSSGAGVSTQNHGWETTEEGQARMVRALLTRVVRARRRLGIRGVSWYTWLSPELGRPQSFDYSGLRRLQDGRIVDKPALGAFRQTIRRLR